MNVHTIINGYLLLEREGRGPNKSWSAVGGHFFEKKLARDAYYEPEKTNNPPIAIDPIHGHCIVAADLFMITNSTQHITNMFDFCKSFVNLKFFIIHWPSISNLGRTWRGTGSQALMTWLALIRAVIIFNPFIMENINVFINNIVQVTTNHQEDICYGAATLIHCSFTLLLSIYQVC